MLPLRRTLLLSMLLAGCGTHPTAPLTKASADPVAAQAARTVAIKLRPGAQALSWGAGVRETRAIAKLGWRLAEVSGDRDAAMRRLRALPGVVAVEPDSLLHLDSLPFNDPDLPLLAPSHGKVQVERAWTLTTGSPDVVVAILDTGIDARHPDLEGRLVPGWDVLGHDADPADDHSHGTACAGLVAAEPNNGLGVAGFAPDTRVMPVKVLNRRGVGPLEWAAEGIVWATDHGAGVLSMSFGEDAPSQLLQDAVDYARAHNVVVVASMGNDGEEVKHWPAACPGVLAVGATYDDDRPALFTTEGDWVGICAPGTRVYTTFPTYEIIDPMFGKMDVHYGYFSGTSAAGPIVAAVAGLVKSRYPAMREDAVRALLRRTADDVGTPGYDKQSGDGRVNAWRALTEATR